MSGVMFDKILGRLREGGDGGGGGGGDTPKTITVHDITNLLGELTDAQLDDLHVGDIIYDDEIDTFRVGTWWFVVSKDYYDYQYYLNLVRLGITVPNDYNTVKESWLYFDMREYIRLVTPVEGRYWKDAGMARKDFALTHSWNKAMDALVRYDWVENASFWKNGDYVQATDGLYLIVGSKGDPTRRFVKVDAESVTEVIYKYAHSTVYYDYYETRTTYLRTSVYTLQPQDGMVPNVLYNLGELTGDTTFALAAATDNTIANVWTWTFETGATAPTITWPQQITMWEGGYQPSIKANTHYEIRVMGGFAICFSNDNHIKKAVENLENYVGADDLPTFDNATYYRAGSYVKYNGSIWRFTTAHQIGSWTGEDAIETSIFDELQSFVSADKENVFINVSSSDNQLTVEGLQVSVYFEDTQQTQLLTCDANGDCNISIDKGRVFTLSVPNQSGYYHPASYKLRANVNARYVFFVYETTISGYCDITVNMAKSGGRVGEYPGWNGQTVTLILSGNGGARSATIANGVAVFEDVPKGYDATIYAPTITGWRKPAAATVNTNYNEVSVTMTYEFITATGIFMVRTDGQEFTYETWDTQDTCVAIHFATQDLMEAGCDWYMNPFKGVTSGDMDSIINTAISLNIWNQNTPDYDGKAATSIYVADVNAKGGSTEQLVNDIIDSTLTINGNIMNGFLPTRDQIQPLYDNKEYVISIINLINGINVFNVSNISVVTVSSSTSPSVNVYEIKTENGGWITRNRSRWAASGIYPAGIALYSL